MRVWRTIPDWQQRRRELKGSIGLVPTMGALHDGHASLVTRCRSENDVVVATIFVNPTQFNDPRDLIRYPRTLDQDLTLLEALGTDEVLVPDSAGMYPDVSGLRVIPTRAEPVMESKFRPGFLDGVLTVVLKIFNLARAHRAYFGEKDFQQLRAVEELSRTFFCETEIIACPTLREPSGLAMSSRNVLLSPAARETASELHRVLTTASNPAAAAAALQEAGFQVDYVEEQWGRRLAAVHLDGIRLIDNIALDTRT